MNGFGVNLSETDQAIQDQQTENLVRATRSWQELFQWGRDEATRIQQTEMPRAYRQASQIPVTIWEERAQPTFDASCRAWLGFAQLASFEDLYESVKYLYEIGEVPEPETPPYPHWKPQPHTG